MYFMASVSHRRDAGHGRVVTAAAGVHPGAVDGIAVGAERAPVVGRRAAFAAPDRERVALDLVDVVQRVALGVVEAGHDVHTGLHTERPVVADDLHTADLSTVVVHVDVLN